MVKRKAPSEGDFLLGDCRSPLLIFSEFAFFPLTKSAGRADVPWGLPSDEVSIAGVRLAVNTKTLIKFSQIF